MLSPGEGRVNGYDLGYLLSCYSKRDKRALLRVQCSKHGVLLSILTDIFYRVSTGGVYGVDYKRKDITATESKDAKDSKPKAKRSSTKKLKVEEAEAAPVGVSAPEAVDVEEQDAA